MREWLIGLTLMVFGFIIAITALEFGLSKFAPQTFNFTDFYEPDEYIGYKGVPSKEKKYVNISIGVVSNNVKRNSHGFRDKERTYEKKKGTFRILVIGDSLTEALQVPLEQTYPYILEKRLNMENNKRFEVINLGVSGFGTVLEYLALKHYGLKYQPDFVTLAFFIGNDVYDNSLILNPPPAETPYLRSYFVLNNGKLEEIPFNKVKVDVSKDEEQTKKGVTGQFQILKDFLIKNFPNIYYLLSDRVNKIPWLADFLLTVGIKNKVKKEIPMPYYVYAKQYPSEWQNAWEVTKALILKLKKELEMNKIGFLVVIIPNEFEFRPDIWDKILDENSKMRTFGFDIRKPERILSKFLKTNNIDYLLLRPEFEKYNKEADKDLHIYFPRDTHWNADGHALVAQLIYKKLKEDKLVQIERGNSQ